MAEKTENKTGNPVLLKTNKVIVLVLAVIFFVFSIFNVYLEIQRQWECGQVSQQIAVKNFQTIQDSQFDIYDYIVQKEAFENVCLKRTGIGSYVWAIVSFWFLGYAITLFGKHLEPVRKYTKLNKK